MPAWLSQAARLHPKPSSFKTPSATKNEVVILVTLEEKIF